MTLDDCLTRNEELTATLLQALAGGDEAACEHLLQQRALALTELDGTLRAGGEARRAALQPRLQALADADCTLRLAAETALAQAGEAFRTHCGGTGRGPAAPDRAPEPACLDRRA
ncbi:MAG: hypothetical protein IPO18_14195 [bacterium]|nr:hypothetical protein [bacterium]MBK9473400.1 hypothetical protein [bacterium]